MRRRVLIIGAAVIAVVVIAAIALSSVAAKEPKRLAAKTVEARATVAVTQGDLTQSTTTTGALEYGGGRRVATDLSGTITALAKEGVVVKQGQTLFEVNRSPVVRLNGKVPAWRDLQAGMSDGIDVEQLETALRELGYPRGYTMEVDDDWSWFTTIAVKQWQDDCGLEETGKLPLGSVVFSKGNLRVTSRIATIGGRVQPGTEVLEVSDERRLVTATLESSQRSLAAAGAVVDLQFPDGVRAHGRVTAVKVIPAADEKSDETLSVTIEAANKGEAGKMTRQLDGASVQVTFRQVLAKKVLLVPVSALVALSDGTYAVEVVKKSGGTRLVRVTTQAYGDTSVAVRGSLRVGDKVVVTP